MFQNRWKIKAYLNYIVNSYSDNKSGSGFSGIILQKGYFLKKTKQHEWIC